MLSSSRSRKVLVICALPLALWAALPAVRWCPLGWTQACAVALLRCSAMQSPAACDPAGDRCPVADAKCAPATHEACAPGSECPFAATAEKAAPSRHEASRSARVYCAGDPNGGAGVLAQSLVVHSATQLHVIVPAPHLDVRLESVAGVVPQLASRPPPRAWLRQPPARAPPSLRVT